MFLACSTSLLLRGLEWVLGPSPAAECCTASEQWVSTWIALRKDALIF